MVKMEGNGQIRIFKGRLDEVKQISVLGIFTGTSGNLKNQRGFFFFGGIDNPLDNFHIIDVESPNRIVTFISFLEHVFRSYKWHNTSSYQ